MKIRSFGDLYNSISDSIAGFWKKFLELPAVKQTVDFFKNFSLRRIYFKTGLFLASKFKIIKLQDYFKDKLDNFEDVCNVPLHYERIVPVFSCLFCSLLYDFLC